MENRFACVSKNYLLKKVLCMGGSHVHFLRDCRKYDPDIIVLRKGLVGHVASFRENGLTLRDRVEAVYHNGLLMLTIPKSELAKPHRIPIRAGHDGPRQGQ